MVKISELLVNIVIGNKPKVRDWLSFFHIAARRHKITGEKAEPNPPSLYMWNVVNS
jgi:hypothetical protein